MLACASGGEPAKTEPAPEPDKPEKAEKPSWWVDGKKASNDELVGAVMDLYGGDPGPICFKGPAQGAAKKAKKAFGGDDRFLTSKVDGDDVVITTRDPFADGKPSPSSFSACP